MRPTREQMEEWRKDLADIDSDSPGECLEDCAMRLVGDAMPALLDYVEALEGAVSNLADLCGRCQDSWTDVDESVICDARTLLADDKEPPDGKA